MRDTGGRVRLLEAWLGLVVGLTALIASACDRSAELDAELRARQAHWTREIAAIRAQQSNIMVQFQTLQAPAVGNTPAFAAHARTKAIVLGAYQSLSDLDNVASQAARRVESANKKSARAGSRALEIEHAQVLSEVRRMWEHLAVAQKEIVELQQTAGMASVAQGGST